MEEAKNEDEIIQIDTSEKNTQIENATFEKTSEEKNLEPEKSDEIDSELKKRNDDAEQSSDNEDNLQNDQSEKDNEETKVPLMKDDSVNIDIKPAGDDTATLPIHKKKKDGELQKKKPPIYLFPITRMKLAWTSSSNICEFVMRATIIIFSTLGWMFCVGGLPFVSLVMLIIGSIYIDDCPVQPNIPVYLIVSGVFGTVQHVISLWTKYIPKESQGRLKIYRSYCRVIDGVITLFITIWFVLGCIWVYGVKEVEFEHKFKLEYCNKTLYYFAFWMMNLSFMILCILIVLSLCCILCIVSTPKDEEKGVVQ